MTVVNKKIFPFKQFKEKWLDFNLNFLDKQRTNPTNKKYILGMLPYPSGKLHMGHVRNYTIVDIMARFYYLKGDEVFCPIGWDAFGLPAENAAKEFNSHPKIWTDNNISVMKKQLQELFFLYNWKNEIKTCDVSYYKWQQQLFIEMWKKGYITKKLSYIDYDPVDKTTLAKEQITADGRGWRSGALVEKRLLSQWFFKISDFNERLLQDLEKLSGHWPDQIITMQRNWIGKTPGFGITFKVNVENDTKSDILFDKIEIFTKSPYYLPKVEFIGVAPDSEYGIFLYETIPEVKEFIQKHPRLSNVKTADMRGFNTGLQAINPYNNEKLPIYIANYVLGDYGTGIVMGVPSICENDHQFATKNQIAINNPINIDKEYLANNMNNQQSIDLTAELKQKGLTYDKMVYKLKDWCISRQRYWGCPIPIIHCPTCGMLENKNIPVNLSEDIYNEDWTIVCWKCGGQATRESDTMDTFVDSSWYQYRYPSAQYTQGPLDPLATQTWPKVDIYVGGPEHAVLHLLFARFFGKMLKDMGYIPEDEPFASLYTQGMICMQIYKTAVTSMFVNPEETFEENGKLYYKTPNGEVERVVVGNFEKMSKSKKNTIDPQRMLDTYGVDALRLSVVSDTPANKDLAWNTDNLNGCWIFINKIWSLTHYINDLPEGNHVAKTMDDTFHEYALDVFFRIIQDIEEFNFNIAIANFRILVNYIEDNIVNISKNMLTKVWTDYIILFWCLCPIISSEVLAILNVDTRNITLPFAQKKIDTICTLVVQKNGKKIDVITALLTDDEETIIQKIKDNNIIINEYKKVIFIKGRAINFVS